ncbi:outer membrane biogenesis protein BamB [Planctomycetes bacterium MalM25]|nr:outer membrane biogenesis protein BamB [Planctomycetes bacterium MalM25]
MLRSLPRALAAIVLIALSDGSADAADWARFRGPNGTGVSPDPAPPVTWGNNTNLAWKIELPGPGSSSPIVVGDRVLVTCYTGYGLNTEDPGDQADLKRVLACYERSTGEELWKVEVPAKLPEDEYGGMFAQHGYASHTPVSDGERVYAYFGRSGAHAFDLQGNRLWQTDCGDGFGAKRWGSASSPILHGDLVIFAATAEANALIALNKKTGEEVWRFGEEGWNGCWSTPVLVEVAGRTELVAAAPFKMFGLNPDTGEELWQCRGVDNDTVTSSPVVEGDTVYLLAGRGGSLAVRAGGTGDVTDSHVVWSAPLRGSIASPLIHEGRIHWIGRNGVDCVDAATAERIYQARLQKPEGNQVQANTPPQGPPRGPRTERDGRGPGGEGRRFGGGGRFGRGGGGGGRFGQMPYASPVVAGDRMYHLGRDGTGYVIRLGEKFEQIAVNQLSDGGDFSGTPALSEGDLFIRSSKHLFCVREQGGKVAVR